MLGLINLEIYQTLIFFSDSLLIDVVLCAGSMSALYIGALCTCASYRDRDDYKNAIAGGVMAGIPVGFYCELMCLCSLGGFSLQCNEWQACGAAFRGEW